MHQAILNKVKLRRLRNTKAVDMFATNIESEDIKMRKRNTTSLPIANNLSKSVIIYDETPKFKNVRHDRYGSFLTI